MKIYSFQYSTTLCLFISLDSWRIMYACYKITLCNYYFIFFRVHKNSLFLLKGNDLVMKIETPKSKVDAFNWKRIIRSKELLIITYFPDTFLDNKLGERAEFSIASYSFS